jgi:hypothetical protein
MSLNDIKVIISGSWMSHFSTGQSSISSNINDQGRIANHTTMDLRKRVGPKHGLGGKVDRMIKWEHVESWLRWVPS